MLPESLSTQKESSKDGTSGTTPPGGFFKREPIVAGPKIGRNKPCICGSGKKYKKCCLIKMQKQIETERKKKEEMEEIFDGLDKKKSYTPEEIAKEVFEESDNKPTISDRSG